MELGGGELMGYVHMACCGGILGHHEHGCEDAIPWSDEERTEGEEIARASEREAVEFLEASR